MAAGDSDILTLVNASGSEVFVINSSGVIDTMPSISARLTTTDGVTAGTAKVIGGRASSNIAASAAVTYTTTETDFDVVYTMPADTMKAGTVIRILAMVEVTSGNSTDTLTLKLKIGSVVLVASAALDVTDGGGDTAVFDYTLICRTTGTGGTMLGYGMSAYGPEGSSTARHATLASTAVDTTASHVIKASAEWSVASTANSCRLDGLVVTIA